MTRKRRTEEVSASFENKVANGWAFAVGDCFRTQLDIRLDERVDKDAAAAKRLKLGRKLEPSETPKRMVWTQGSPPAYSFDRGHMLHQRDVDGIVRRTVIVLQAKPDTGALIERRTDDDETVVSDESDVDVTGDGWVEFELIGYHGSAEGSRQRTVLTQQDFVYLLRTGTEPTVTPSGWGLDGPSNEGHRPEVPYAPTQGALKF